MLLISRLWAAATSLANFLAFPSVDENGVQRPLPTSVRIEAKTHLVEDDYPKFTPPDEYDREHENFQCEYPSLKGWRNCWSAERRGGWLCHNDKEPFDINTDYEKRWPEGREREYSFDIVDKDVDTDGIVSKNMKLVDGKYPGKSIKACWGDKIKVHVTNNLNHNGTAIHWHGLRMLKNSHMDSVPGVTQCPIAPGETFTYTFTASQYGTSWYHSHYSVQYADGLLGPITIYGPSSDSFDEYRAPLIMSDWFHQSSFEVIHKGVQHGFPSILLNGIGDVTKYGSANAPYPNPDGKIRPKHTVSVRSGKRYLLRLVNTAFSTTFIFSIDHHRLTIVEADFVPVEPASRTHIIVGIGQRYNVIVTANPENYGDGRGLPVRRNFWVRTTVAKCFNNPIIGVDSYDKTGILRYESDDGAVVDMRDPYTAPWADIQERCMDEEGLVPILKWQVGEPINGENQKIGEEFHVSFKKRPSNEFPLATWSLQPVNPLLRDDTPFQIDYNDPTFLHLSDRNRNWRKPWVVVPESFNENDWVYLTITGAGGKTPGSHPMHLHGHDFAILATGNSALDVDKLTLKLDNPMRRDSVHLNDDGYVVLAFKADNPGTWIMHCHIAFHASEGLALQILERQRKANRKWPPNSNEVRNARNVCARWKLWRRDCRHYWPGEKEVNGRMCYPACDAWRQHGCKVNNHIFQDDSGV